MKIQDSFKLIETPKIIEDHIIIIMVACHS